MPIQEQDWIVRSDLKKNRDKYYLFGDNCVRLGYKGQAQEMRGEPNAIGIRTKFYPSNKKISYFTDEKFQHCCYLIAEDLLIVSSLLKENKTIIIPTSGVGSGLAKLEQCAPRVNKFLEHCIEYLKEKYGFIPAEILE
jgi:hypothetical protein